MEAPMKTETPQRIHRQDYTPPPFLVDQVELDVQFHAAKCWSAASSACGAIRPPPGQALQLDGHGLETLSAGNQRQPPRRRRLHLQ
jgi:aminopeptidase N